ncbi:hypothetical protein AAMO2058_001658400 [Amorphochlora amoebiformis]
MASNRLPKRLKRAPSIQNLDVLLSMGFTHVENSADALRKTNGNVELALEILLNSKPEEVRLEEEDPDQEALEDGPSILDPLEKKKDEADEKEERKWRYKNVDEWKEETVVEWVHEHALKYNIKTKTAEILKEQDLNGWGFMELSMQDLTDIQICTLGQRKSVLRASEELKILHKKAQGTKKRKRNEKKKKSKAEAIDDGDILPEEQILPFEGMIICITGTLPLLRSLAEEAIYKGGGQFSSSLTRKVTHLVLGDGGKQSTSKRIKAQELGIPMKTQMWFMKKMDKLSKSREEPKPNIEIEAGGMFKVPDTDYEIRFRGGVYYCTCPAWKFYGGAIDTRTCKHLATYLGEEFENFRTRGGLRTTRKPKGRGKVAGKKGPPGVLLAKKWSGEDIKGWWMSEKLDGVRAYWNGTNLVSRLGNVFHAPDWFIKGLPEDSHFDGEIFGGRKKFQDTVGIVKSHDAGERWKGLTYEIFDKPSLDSEFEDRVKEVKEFVAGVTNDYFRAVEHILCKGQKHVEEQLEKMVKSGAEGLMLRKPKSKYVRSRSKTLLKVKKFFDCEAIVCGYNKGKGKYKGQAGSLDVKLINGKKFNVGSGLSDADRNNPPAIGSIITVKYQELTTKEKVPRFPTYLGIRIDADKSKWAHLL